jgi:hypothetical protein
MNKILIDDKIQEDFSRRVVACVEKALNDDIKRYIAEFQPDTTNGLPHQVHDFINSNLKNSFSTNNMRIVPIKRFGWNGRVLVDEVNKLAFSVMRNNRLKSLMKEHRNNPHYTQTFANALNGNLEAKMKQLSFDDMVGSRFTDEDYMEDYDKLCGININLEEGYHHCLILFETQNGELSDINISLLNKDMGVVEEYSLSKFIKPDYSNLINKEFNNGDTLTKEKAINVIPLPLKGKSLVKIKLKEEANSL